MNEATPWILSVVWMVFILWRDYLRWVAGEKYAKRQEEEQAKATKARMAALAESQRSIMMDALDRAAEKDKQK